MILTQNRNHDWVWETTAGEQLSPVFITRHAAWSWKELIFNQVKLEIVGEPTLNKQQPEPISEECTCDNCGCN
jgi:hypothetical protein